MTERARCWLESSAKPRVLHSFAAVCNLVNERGEVLALQTAVLPLGPFSWQVAALPAVLADASVTIDPERCLMRLDNAVFGWHNMALWSPIPAWERLGKRPFLSSPVRLTAVLQARWQRYLQAIEAADLAEMCIAAVALAGLGSGLTPTGDDLLIGSLYALRVQGFDPLWLAEIGAAAAARTSTLSANFLLAAAVGEAVAPWHELVNGLPGAVGKITAVGERSGRESWFGFCQTRHVFYKT